MLRGSGCLHLSGMMLDGVTEGVNVWRPLLSHDKSEIYDFAHTYGVPYLQDTTPSWSTRGKLRNQLLPLLQDIYGSGCMKNLSFLAASSDAMRDLVQETIFGPFLDQVKRYKNGISVHISERYRKQSAIFWAEALKQIMHSMNMSMVREKGVLNFVNRINILGKKNHGKDQSITKSAQDSCNDSNVDSTRACASSNNIMPGWIELRKGFNCYIDDQNTLFILRPGVLRPSGSASRSSGKNSEVNISSNNHDDAGSVDIYIAGKDVARFVPVSTGSNGVVFDILVGDETESTTFGNVLTIKSPSQICYPVYSILLNINTHFETAVENPCPDLNTAHIELRYSGWKIDIKLTQGLAIAGSTKSIHEKAPTVSVPEINVLSDGDHSDLEEDSIWKWSPGVTTDKDRVLSPTQTESSAPLLKDINDVLYGKFSYEFSLYGDNCKTLSKADENDSSSTNHEVRTFAPLQLCAGATAAALRNLRLESLRGLEQKLQEGLPLICPVNLSEQSLPVSKQERKKLKNQERDVGSPIVSVVVCYTFIGGS